jgi:hypothetical protein
MQMRKREAVACGLVCFLLGLGLGSHSLGDSSYQIAPRTVLSSSPPLESVPPTSDQKTAQPSVVTAGQSLPIKLPLVTHKQLPEPLVPPVDLDWRTRPSWTLPLCKSHRGLDNQTKGSRGLDTEIKGSRGNVVCCGDHCDGLFPDSVERDFGEDRLLFVPTAAMLRRSRPVVCLIADNYLNLSLFWPFFGFIWIMYSTGG